MTHNQSEQEIWANAHEMRESLYQFQFSSSDRQNCNG